MGGHWDRSWADTGIGDGRTLGWVDPRSSDGRVPPRLLGESRAGDRRVGGRREADPQQCRNARGVAARGGGRAGQTPDARLRLRLPWAAGRWLVQRMSLRAPHPPVPSALRSTRTKRARRRSTQDPARYREGGGAGLGGLGGARPVWQHFPALSPLPRSSSTPMPASRGRNGRSGTTSPTPRPGSSHTPSPSESSGAGRDSGGARTRGTQREGSAGTRSLPVPGMSGAGSQPGLQE